MLWERFWCSPEGTIPLYDDGFVVDPTDESWTLLASDLRAFSTIDNLDCLVLLGEPGIGKSTAMRQALAHSGGETQENLWIDLAAYGSEDRLATSLLHDHKIETWKSDDSVLTLFLDSLDECLLRISNVSALLNETLPQLPLNRLRLRIACRTAQWPDALGSALMHMWPKQFGSFELVPLRRRDVREAAEAFVGQLVEEFMTQIVDRDVVPLTIKPVTLQLLLRLFVKGGSLPMSQLELYERGTLLLCEEFREGVSTSGISPAQKVAVAARLAAMMTLGARRAVWIGPDWGESDTADLFMGEALGKTETWNHQTANVTPTEVAAALNTGLFTKREGSRLGWAHQSYADFLAARFMVHRLTVPQIMGLVTRGGGASTGVVPQLESLVAWVATQSHECFASCLKQIHFCCSSAM